MKDIGANVHEFEVLSAAKETLKKNLSRDALRKEYAKIVAEYEALVRETGKQTGSPREMPDSPGVRPDEIREIKRGLLSHLTHEFLTPLNLIISPVEQMIAKCQNPEKKKVFSMIYRNGQRVFLVINQVLELLKLESRNYKLKAGQHNLIPFLKGILANFELLAEEKELDLIFDTEQDRILLYFDREKLAEVVCNLVMSSLKHTPPGGRISLSVGELPGNSLEISLKNTEAKIPPDKTTRIFDRSHHLSDRFEHYIKGLGIGLFLAGEYIKLHHGSIRVNNEEGKGTEFIIRLPQGKDHLQSDEIIESQDAWKTMGEGDAISRRYAYMLELDKEEQLQEWQQNSGSPGKEKNGETHDVVLVVEDNTDMRNYITTLLTDQGFIVVEAENGSQGIYMSKKIIPDIIISDIMMPGKTGYQLCTELKKDVSASHIPVILLSVKFEDDDIIKGLEAGADDYITKPFNSEILLTRIKNLLKQRRRLQQRIQLDTVMPAVDLALSSLDDQFIKSIKETIEENLSDPGFGLDELADALFMSRTTLYRKLNSLTGQAPKKFIQSYRLKRSLELLKSNFGNVTEVAFKVGFSNSAYFTKCFKEAYNRLPSAFTIS